MSNVVNLGKGKMSPENLAHEIPWKELNHIFLIAERKDGRIMIGATMMDMKTAALLKMIASDALTDLAHMAGMHKGCGDPSCKNCAPTPPPPPTDEDDWEGV